MSPSPKHEYPSLHPPGTHWATDAAWEILDIIKPGLIPNDVRSFLAGAIAGRLIRERDAAIQATQGLNPSLGSARRTLKYLWRAIEGKRK